MNYLEHFGLNENPFDIVFKDSFYFESQPAREALARLMLLADSGGGIFHLYGKCGSGKTIIIDKFIKQISRQYHSVLINFTALGDYCFLLKISQELGLPNRNNKSNLVLEIQSFINNSGQPVCLIIDEAQNLEQSALEAVRLIAAPNISTRKLFLVLSSLPDMKNKITVLPSLKQRITCHFHLTPLTMPEAKEYFNFRLQKALAPNNIFSEQAITEIVRISEGIPREINKFANLSLITAASFNKRVIDRDIIESVIAELSLY